MSADLPDPAAARVLSLALAALRRLTGRLRDQLLLATTPAAGDSFLELELMTVLSQRGWRQELERLLAEAGLAAALAGAGAVADGLAGETPSPEPGLTAPPPPALQSALSLLSGSPDAFRDAYLAAMMPQQADALRGLLGGPPSPPETWAPDPPHGDSGPLFPLILAAAESLARRNVLTKERYEMLASTARRDAFTVAGLQEQHVVEAVRGALVESVAQGPDLRGFRRRVVEAVGAGTFLSEAHAETVFRTGVQQGYSDGMDTLLADPIIGDAFPYEEMLPIADSRLCPICETVSRSGIQGTAVFRRDDPVWQKLKPPLHPNDRCGRNPLTMEQAAAKGIREAQEWLRTGQPPTSPAFVAMPVLKGGKPG